MIQKLALIHRSRSALSVACRLAVCLIGCLTLSVSAAAQDAKGTGVAARSNGEPGKPYRKVFALLVGANHFASARVPGLYWAENDVQSMREILIQKFGVNPSDITILAGSEATKKNIMDELVRLSDSEAVQPTDAVLVYFSLHGQSLRTSSGNAVGYLIPQDAKLSLTGQNPAIFNREAIGMQSIMDTLDSSPARHVLVIADACFSGLFGRSKGGAIPIFIEQNFRRVGREVLAGAGAAQSAKEDQGAKHGRFTAALLRELESFAQKKQAFVTDDLFDRLRYSASFEGQEPAYEVWRGDGRFTFMPDGVLRGPASVAVTGSSEGEADADADNTASKPDRKNSDGATKVSGAVEGMWRDLGTVRKAMTGSVLAIQGDPANASYKLYNCLLKVSGFQRTFVYLRKPLSFFAVQGEFNSQAMASEVARKLVDQLAKISKCTAIGPDDDMRTESQSWILSPSDELPSLKIRAGHLTIPGATSQGAGLHHSKYYVVIQIDKM